MPPVCLGLAFCLWKTGNHNAAVLINTHETVLNTLDAVYILQFNLTPFWSNAILLLFILVPLSKAWGHEEHQRDKDPLSDSLCLELLPYHGASEESIS